MSQTHHPRSTYGGGSSSGSVPSTLALVVLPRGEKRGADTEVGAANDRQEDEAREPRGDKRVATDTVEELDDRQQDELDSAQAHIDSDVVLAVAPISANTVGPHFAADGTTGTDAGPLDILDLCELSVEKVSLTVGVENALSLKFRRDP